ncbi:CocE/NonD family hydrolase [Streptomyces erythrochromogenes]|uniref:CocE/NonD family hydrolase n=1 Tax=Streptomyces erythrochromogenes TaxID=285574 RepID=UPI003864DF28|nr:CocE/NonD family hydrolase [Streptomyces erythrochromogenes]
MTPAAQPPFSLYPELDATALGAFVSALESGDVTGLPPARAAEVAEARALAAFTRGRITGADGDLLDAALWRHTGAQPRPMIVMPSPWTSLGWLAYAVQATLFAARGYNVIAYSARGFAGSEGQVDVAGPLDVADGSRALDHLIERSTGPVTKIGFLGDSYGSGIGQLVAAHDTRVDAVVALSTWGDLGEAFYENSTRHVAAVEALLRAAAKARLSPQTQSVFDNVLTGSDVRGTLRWAEVRSPFTHIKELNRRQVPVFFSHAWHETLFPPNQTLRMFNELTGPKRLAVSIGDHSGPEMSGVLGLPNRIWTDAHRWFDHHLKDIDNGIGDEGQFIGEVMWSKTLEPRPTWPSVTEQMQRLYLADGGGLGPRVAAEAEAKAEAEAGWTATVLCGMDTPATVADKVVESGYAEMAGRPKIYLTEDIDRTVAAVWTAEPAAETVRLRGTPRLRVTYRAANPGSTFVAYLLDTAPDGSAHLVTHAPYSDLESPPDSLISADIELQATAYDVQRGHRLMLVIDARDPFYADANLPRATLAFTSPEATPSYLDLPLG